MADRLWYRRREVSGGGVVAGMGIHYFDLLLEYFGHVQIDRVVLLTSRKHPNAPDTTSENYARFSLSCARIHHVDLRLSCWKDYERLPSEVLVGQIGDTPFRFQRPLNFDHGSVLGREFSHYAEAIRQGASHPTKGTMLKAHSLVLEAYELGKGSKHTAKTP
jgi:predicted dehydrogenase